MNKNIQKCLVATFALLMLGPSLVLFAEDSSATQGDLTWIETNNRYFYTSVLTDGSFTKTIIVSSHITAVYDDYVVLHESVLEAENLIDPSENEVATSESYLYDISTRGTCYGMNWYTWLWITDDEIAAGQALFGQGDTYTLVDTTTYNVFRYDAGVNDWSVLSFDKTTNRLYSYSTSCDVEGTIWTLNMLYHSQDTDVWQPENVAYPDLPLYTAEADAEGFETYEENTLPTGWVSTGPQADMWVVCDEASSAGTKSLAFHNIVDHKIHSSVASVGSITTPVIIIPDDSPDYMWWLDFDQRFELGSMITPGVMPWHDTITVEIMPSGGTPEIIFQASGIDKYWHTYRTPLDGYDGQPVQFRFTFDHSHAYGWSTYEGWYIDQFDLVKRVAPQTLSCPWTEEGTGGGYEHKNFATANCDVDVSDLVGYHRHSGETTVYQVQGEAKVDLQSWFWGPGTQDGGSFSVPETMQYDVVFRFEDIDGAINMMSAPVTAFMPVIPPFASAACYFRVTIKIWDTMSNLKEKRYYFYNKEISGINSHEDSWTDKIKAIYISGGFHAGEEYEFEVKVETKMRAWAIGSASAIGNIDMNLFEVKVMPDYGFP